MVFSFLTVSVEVAPGSAPAAGLFSSCIHLPDYLRRLKALNSIYKRITPTFLSPDQITLPNEIHIPSVLLVHYRTARQKSSVSPQSPVAPLLLQRCFLPVGHAAAAFAVLLAKLAGGQAEVPDHDASHVPQANPPPLA